MRNSVAAPLSSSTCTHAPKKTPAAVVRWPRHDDHSLEPLAQETHPAVDFAQLPLAVDVFRVLRAVALRRRFLHGPGHLRAQDAPQFVEFGAQPAFALGVEYLEPGAVGFR